MGQDPVNWVDPEGLKPGDPFGSADDAAMDAIRYILSTQPQGKNDPEWGGWVYEFMNDKGEMCFSYTDPVPGTNKEININTFNDPPLGAYERAVYHTHTGRHSEVKNFSPDDWTMAILYPVYMGTRIGVVQVYDHNQSPPVRRVGKIDRDDFK